MLIGNPPLSTRLLLLAVTAASCGQPGDNNCDGDRCNSAETREALLASLEGFSDPISGYLREVVREDGSLPGDYREILMGMATVLDCNEDELRSFIVLSNEALNPKTIFNHCANTPAAASEFFLLLPELGADKDIEPQIVHMTSWDDEAGEYRRYATAPHEGGGMSINVQPIYCLSCHAGPRELGTWQPLMNEMTNPWSQWNAEPGFRSHIFDEFLSQTTAEGAVYEQASAPGLLDSASNFEPIIRAGIDRVTGARAQTRNNAANIDEALTLLQPLFCDEQANYVSEIHKSGEFRNSVVVDASVRELLVALDAGDEFEFVRQETMRIAPVANDSEQNLTLMAVRGESSLRSELALVTRQVLDPIQVLQVRSLDWSRPVASEFRCDLYDAAVLRLASGGADTTLDSLPVNATNADLLPLLLSEIMTLDVDGTPVSLAPTAAAVFSIPDAKVADFEALSTLERTPTELGAEMQQAIDSMTRETLEAIRIERVCDAVGQYLVAPIVPGIDC